jgi:hypothetical protein
VSDIPLMGFAGVAGVVAVAGGVTVVAGRV